MQIKISAILVFIGILILHACNSGKRLTANELKEVTLEPIVVVPEMNWNEDVPVYKTYHSTPTRKNDLIHMDLQVSFDRSKRSVSGISILKLSPLFYPTSTLELDAKDFEIHSLVLNSTNSELPYDYDGSIIKINLDRTYKRDETYEILINYTAFPERSFSEKSGAIQSDQGLFFIDPDETIPDVPTQIWSQGETEHNSNWFPTIDQPNERATQDIRIKVEDRFQTLSNGVLVSSENHNDGFRTDHWQLHKPHAPYLVVVAVGEFAEYKTSWNGMELTYLAEKEYEPHLPTIYEHTPEMLSFFSQRLGIPYAWPAFNQIVVRDFVSGAMENTTAIIYSQMVQRTDKSLKDYDNDKIIAHEMSHHWFGNLVTCESWANIPLNEGFANYSEYLWLEHKYGRQEADAARHSEQSAYFQESFYKARPLIKYDYADAESLFDAHSYNKGGLVLHMLRRLLGDEAFFLSLKKYLEDNSFNTVELDHLRLACESVSGMDLNWFFDQWYHKAGHPVLDVSYNQTNDNELLIYLNQKQDSITWASEFILPVEFDVYIENGEKVRESAWVKNRIDSVSLSVTGKVLTIEFDPDKSLLANVSFTREVEEARVVFLDKDASFQTRFDAFVQMGDLPSSDYEIIKKCLEDPFWYWRMTILKKLNTHSIYDWEEKIREIAEKDPNSRVRAEALATLASSGDKMYIPILESAIDEYYSNNTLEASLEGLFYLDSTLAVQKAIILDISNEPHMYPVIGFIYTAYGDPDNLPHMEKYFDKVVGYGALDYFEHYAYLLSKTTEKNIINKSEILGSLGKDKNQSPWRKIGVIKALNTLMKLAAQGGMSNLNEVLSDQVQGILDAEENPQVISIMRSLIME
jgi:aminopeptidase N